MDSNVTRYLSAAIEYSIAKKAMLDEINEDDAILEVVKEIKDIFGKHAFKGRKPKNTVAKIIAYKMLKQFVTKTRAAAIIGIDHSTAFRYDTNVAYHSIAEYIVMNGRNEIDAIEDVFNAKIEAIIIL